MWHGTSRDLAHEAHVVRDGSGARVIVDGAERGAWSEVAYDALRWTSRGVVVPVRDGERWRVLGPDGAGDVFDAIADLRVAGDHVVYQGARGSVWQLVVDGAAVASSSAPIRDIVVDERGAFAAIVRAGAHERVVRDGSASAELPLGVRDVTLGAKGRVLAYVVTTSDRREQLAVDHTLSEPFDEILELAIAADAPHWAALVAEGDHTVLLLDGRRVTQAPLLTHLRIGDDGAHVACLSPAPDGGSIDVLLDGTAIAHHRRVDGERLAFVPGTGTLVFLAEDSQGIRVVLGDRASERYESIDGPVLAPGRAGWIGRRGGRHEITIDGVIVGDAEWAGSLRLGRRGHEHAYVVRERGRRFVVTRRGRWPVPRLFVDTLVLDDAGRHWTALVPDAAARRLEVWIDGVPRAELDRRALEAAASGGASSPADAVRAVVAAVLDARGAR